MNNDPFLLEEHYIAHKKEYFQSEILHYPPLWVTLGILSACAYNCHFCAYHSHDARHVSKIYNVKFTMELEEAKKIIDFLHSGYVPRIHVCATGEPLLHKDFFAILDHVIARYGQVSFQSNFPQKCVQQQDAIRKIKERQNTISFITTDLMGNDTIKGGSSEERYETLAQLSETTIPNLKGNFLLTKTNYQDLEVVIRAIHKYRLRTHVSAFPVFPYGMNAFTSIENVWEPEDKERAKALAEIASLACSLKVPLFISPLLASNTVEQTCDVFWKKIQLWPTAGSAVGRNDNVIPHGCNAVVLGNIASLGYLLDFPDVLSFWNSETLRTIRRSILQGIAPDAHCCHCPYLGNLEVAAHDHE